jgi:hypothetical protein
MSSRLVFNNDNLKINSNNKNEKKKESKIKNNNNDNLNFTDYELNSLSYEEAKINDKRTFFQYYISLLKTKHLLIFSFYPSNDNNSKIIKICLFLFSFSTLYIINALFFTDKTMHKIYVDNGIFNFIYLIPKIIYSTIISSIINSVIKYLSLTDKTITDIKKYNYKKASQDFLKVQKNIKIKFLLFFIISIFILGLYWYYISCFCAVYTNTQIILLEDTLIGFGLSLIYPFFIYLIPGFARIPALNDSKICYKISKILQLL